ncbi:MAG: homoserine dehydrogenase, partial [Kiritimatiellaeota bacterium]|nr:homoserine dehydrogenase [Kiritimatiellota bacterium]
VIRDPAVDVIIELIGGTGVAKKFVLESLKLGKPVITANKKLLAEYGAELFAAAAASGTTIHFEASVGGGIPVIKALREGLVANNIKSIYGILNGTCNYILTRMEREKLPFDAVLKAAQAAGYAEAEPSLDIDGHDTAHKALVLASLAYGCAVPMTAAQVEGIRGLAAEDITDALEMGYRIKLLGIVKRSSAGISVRVHPTLVPLNHMLAAVDGVFNAILIDGDIVGQTLYFGRGAGRQATASAVISDLADVARDRAAGTKHRIALPSAACPPAHVQTSGAEQVRCYPRLALLDKPGMLARVAQVLGEHQISIASVMQKESSVGNHVPVVIVTHQAPESAFQAAFAKIDKLDIIGAPTVRLRIEDFA